MRGRKYRGPAPCPRRAWPQEHGSPFSLGRWLPETSPALRRAYIPVWKQQCLCSMYEGVTNKWLFHPRRDHAWPVQRRCSSLQFDGSTRKNPAERINQWKSKELQSWVNQGTHCADLDFHPMPGYSADCWKPTRRTSPPGRSGSTRRQPEQRTGRAQENSRLSQGLELQTPSPL